ncbi:hypothetical protein V8F20_007034 [Naviculisporaceae sp. PSN 640]
MEQVALETATAPALSHTLKPLVYALPDSSLTNTVEAQKFPRRRVPSHSSSPAAGSYLSQSLKGPTTIHIENMGQPESVPKEANIAVPEPVAQHPSETGAAKAPPSECLGVVPHNPGPDSACILTPSGFQANKDSQAAQTCTCGGRKQIMTSKVLGQEKEISEVLNKVNLPKNRETKFTPAASAKTATRGADASLPHRETQQPCQCVHVNQFSRILPTGDLFAGNVFLTKNVDLSGCFRFPPSEMREEDEKMEESVDLTLHKSSLQGFETELEDAVSRYAHSSQEFKRYAEQDYAELTQLREDLRVKCETARQVQANAEATFDQLKQNPSSNASRAQRNVLKAAMAMKAKLDKEIKELSTKLREDSRAANEFIKQSLLIDFEPAQVLADQRRRGEEAELRLAQKQWEIDMMSLYRVQQGPSTTFQKKAWKWHRVDEEEDDKPQMTTYPTGPARLSRRSASPKPVATGLQIPEEIKIPPWFQVLDSSGRVELSGDSPEARYKSLLAGLRDLQVTREKGEQSGATKTWEKEWHEPNPGWPHPHWREHGGWWKCRKGTDATEAERQCRECHQPRQPQSDGGAQSGTQKRARPSLPQRQSTGGPLKKKAPVKKPEVSSSQKHKKLVAEIERAMDECAEKDKMELRARMQAQRQSAEDLRRAGPSRHGGAEGADNNIKIYIIGSPSGNGERQEVVCYGGAGR